MKRPLAIFGLGFLVCMLAAVQLPAAALLWAGAGLFLLLAGCFVFALRRRARVPAPVALLVCAAALACAVRLGYDAVFVRPALALAGREEDATVHVLDVQPGYSGDLVNATVRVLRFGEERPGVKVQISLPGARPGDVLDVRLRLYEFTNPGTAAYRRGRGQLLGAAATGPAQAAGTRQSPAVALRRMQYALGDSIREKLPARLSSVAAAMTVGDRRTLAPATQAAYRAAGLSHLLVVSGLHMTVVSGAVYALLRALLRKRRAAAVGGMFAVVLFMGLTGFTLSVVRSGVACLLVLAAPLFGRRADVPTSLGLAALLLCIQNPYAAQDVGLLLSFSATLGVFAGGEIVRRVRRGRYETPAGPMRRAARALSLMPVVPLCSALATLPVLVAAGYGVSLLTVPMNVLAVPLVGVLVPLGFVMAIPAGVPLLGLVARLAALVAGALLLLLEKLTALCARLPWAVATFRGGFALVVVLAAYLLLFLAWRTRAQRRAFVLCAAVVLALGAGLHTWLDAGTVRITLAGGGSSASLVLTGGRQAVVLYRGRLSSGAVQRVLEQENIQECVLFVDMRRTAQSTEYLSLFSPGEVVVANTDVFAQAVYEPLAGVRVYVKKQAGGTLAVVDVAGWRVGVVAGGVNLAAAPALDVLVPGSGSVENGRYETLLFSGPPPGWADEDARLLQSEGAAQIWLRPGKSVRIREVQDGGSG